MFIVIETHGGAEYAAICVDEEGNNWVTDSKDEAEKYAMSECQNGIVVEL